MSEQKEPKRDFGFYAQIPRIVRTGYKKLTHAEKYFYGCLKDLCGDTGACFRSLRKLEMETDISIGSLTPMINHLHRDGLIHAEKKKRPNGTREVWYITIVDIWQANAKYCAEQTGRSEIEHQEEETSQCSEIEQSTPVNVQNSNITEHKTDVQCSNFATRRIRVTNKGTIEEESNGVSPEVENTPSSNLPDNNKSENDSQLQLFNIPPSNVIPIVRTSKVEQKAKENNEIAEQMVIFVEKRLGRSFPSKVRGNAKDRISTRDRQVEAALKIVQANISLEEFIQAYDKRNDAWWKKERGALNLVHMADKTGRHIMRTIEVLEDIEQSDLFPQGQSHTIPFQSKTVTLTTQEELEVLREKLKTLRQGSREYSEVIAAMLMLREKEKVSM